MSEPHGFGDGKLVRFADSVWTAATPIRFAGVWQSHVMTVVKLSDGGLLLHSPCRLSTDLGEEIAKLGLVTDVVAPNWFHDLYLAAFAWLTSRGDEVTVRLGLNGSLLTFACIAVARIIGMVFDRAGGAMMYLILGSEILGTVLCAWALRLLSPASTTRRG